MAMGFGVGHEAIAACMEQRRDHFQRCRPREEAMKGSRGSRGGGGRGGLLRRQRRCHEAITVCTEQRRVYFQRCRPREEAMKGGRGSEGDEDGGRAS